VGPKIPNFLVFHAAFGKFVRKLIFSLGIQKVVDVLKKMILMDMSKFHHNI